MKVSVYTLPACPNCDRTKIHLDAHEIEYEEIDLIENPSAREYVRDQLGYSQAPVVETEDDSWSGFRPDKIKDLAR